MVRYPHILEYLHEEDATQLPDGSFSKGISEWRSAGQCHARQSTSASGVKAKSGEVRVYRYEITMPTMPPIPEGTLIRVLTQGGINIFGKGKENAAYPVLGCDTRNQRYAKAKIWV